MQRRKNLITHGIDGQSLMGIAHFLKKEETEREPHKRAVTTGCLLTVCTLTVTISFRLLTEVSAVPTFFE